MVILQSEVINHVTDISIDVPSRFSQMEWFFFPQISLNIYKRQNQAALSLTEHLLVPGE